MRTSADSSAQPAPTKNAAHFLHRGRAWRIEKRKESKAWYLYFEDKFGRIVGEEQAALSKGRIRRSLGESTKDNAIVTAKQLIDGWLDRKREAVRQLLQRPDTAPCSTMAQVEAAVERLPIEASTAHRRTGEYEGSTRWNYCASLRRVFCKAYQLTAEQYLSANARLLVNLAEKYFAAVHQEISATTDQRKQNSLKRSAMTEFGSAMALFRPKALRGFKTAGVVLPEKIEELRNGIKEFGFGKVKDHGFEPPSDDARRRMMVEWVRLGRASSYTVPDCPRYVPGGGALSENHQRNMFLAIGMMLAFGVRKSEVMQVKWNWFTTRDGLPFVAAPSGVRVKNQSGRLEVHPLDPFWKVFNRVVDKRGWRGQPDDYVLTELNGHSDRTYWPFYHIGKWLRNLGWNMQKTNHALRDFSASHITMKYGLQDAHVWARHEDWGTTQRNYSRFVDRRISSLRQKRLKWLRFAGT